MNDLTIKLPRVSPSTGWQPGVKRTFVMQNIHGLHARPAALLVETLGNFKCQVQVECGGVPANALSIFGLLALAAGHGSKMTFTATGPEAGEALNAVESLFATNFKDAY